MPENRVSLRHGVYKTDSLNTTLGHIYHYIRYLQGYLKNKKPSNINDFVGKKVRI